MCHEFVELTRRAIAGCAYGRRAECGTPDRHQPRTGIWPGGKMKQGALRALWRPLDGDRRWSRGFGRKSERQDLLHRVDKDKL